MSTAGGLINRSSQCNCVIFESRLYDYMVQGSRSQGRLFLIAPSNTVPARNPGISMRPEWKQLQWLTYLFRAALINRWRSVPFISASPLKHWNKATRNQTTAAPGLSASPEEKIRMARAEDAERLKRGAMENLPPVMSWRSAALLQVARYTTISPSSHR